MNLFKNNKNIVVAYILIVCFSILGFVLVVVSTKKSSDNFTYSVKAEENINSAQLWIGYSSDLESCKEDGSCSTFTNSMGQYAVIDEVIFNDKIWIGKADGTLISCNSKKECINHGKQCSSRVDSMAVFDNKLWLGCYLGVLKSCDASGVCTDHGQPKNAGQYIPGADWYGFAIRHMEIFNNQLWLGMGFGFLMSCNSAGECTDRGRYATDVTPPLSSGDDIYSMAVFDNKLWLGHRGLGYMQSCDNQANCTDVYDPGHMIASMVVFNNKLWLGLSNGDIKKCDNTGNCVHYVGCDRAGDCNENIIDSHTSSIYTMTSFNDKLWFVSEGGFTRSAFLFNCNSNDVCSSIRQYDSSVVHPYVISAGSLPGLEVDEENTIVCEDSDGGKKYYEKGIVRIRHRTYEDECSRDGLIEYHCFLDGESGGKFTLYQCQNGCQNGACLEATSTSSEEGDIATSSEKKVTICHVPPGNSNNTKTIEVSESAVQALLDQGSYLGICIYATNTATSTSNNTEDNNSKNRKGDVISETEKTAINIQAKKLIDNEFNDLPSETKEIKSVLTEKEINDKYINRIKEGNDRMSQNAEKALINFIAYGTDSNTQKLGEGERAAVVYSYKSAFGKLPEDENDFAEILKIANGRWPDKVNIDAEKRVQIEFEKIYKRTNDSNNNNDKAAIAIMAYGLRQKAANRSLESERRALEYFVNIYGYEPSTTSDWNILQAIAYSGSKR